MPLRFNIDHSPASVENGPAVLPGETYDFTDEQVAAGIAGSWSEDDPHGRLGRLTDNQREADPPS